MSNPGRLRSLIEEALNETRVYRVGCFFDNVAAHELEKCARSALPEIEKILQTQVLPEAAALSDHNDLLHRFPGLLGVWIAYFRIGGAEDLPRIVGFLRSMDGPLLATAMLAMETVWHRNNGGRHGTLPPPLLDLIRATAESKNRNLAKLARQRLGFVWESQREEDAPGKRARAERVAL